MSSRQPFYASVILLGVSGAVHTQLQMSIAEYAGRLPSSRSGPLSTSANDILTDRQTASQNVQTALTQYGQSPLSALDTRYDFPLLCPHRPFLARGVHVDATAVRIKRSPSTTSCMVAGHLGRVCNRRVKRLEASEARYWALGASAVPRGTRPRTHRPED